MGNFIIDMLNKLISLSAEAITLVFLLFPDSPFQEPTTPPDAVNLGWITWVFDFPTWILHFSLILVAIGSYYLVRVAARWLKVVRE